MGNYVLFIILIYLCGFVHGLSLKDAVSWISSSSNTIFKLYCEATECCNDEQIPYRLKNFQNEVHKKIYGQHIAVEIILNAVINHVQNQNPKKPLVMSFHGPNGIGKTYISRMIVNMLYKKKEKSRYFHFYYGLESFPLIEKLSEYQSKLKEDIDTALNSCGKSLFVFDGVDYIPPSLLNILMPFIDCPHCGKHKSEKNKSIFIFLTNAGSVAIQNTLSEKLSKGISRKSTKLHDFEKLIISEIFTHDGGLYQSLMIGADAIDFYVPFLPLEKEHVTYCIQEAFEELNVSATTDLIDKVFQELRFGPEPQNLFSNSGCKRVSQITGRIATALNLDFNISNTNNFVRTEL